MKKYSPAPKDVADAIKDAIPVSEKEALGEGWKKLPAGPSSRSKGRKCVSKNFIKTRIQGTDRTASPAFLAALI